MQFVDSQILLNVVKVFTVFVKSCFLLNMVRVYPLPSGRGLKGILMKIQSLLLLEARRNPELNPKVSAYSSVVNRFKKEGDSLFVSFTDIEKLGINPKSKYKTPLGIYSYPARYVVETVRSKFEDMTDLPFAGDKPYVNLFTGSGNIVDVSKMDASEGAKYLKVLTDAFLKLDNTDKPWKDKVDIMQEIIDNSSVRAIHNNYAGGRLWYATMKVAELIANNQGRPVPVVWNLVFRTMNIAAAIDDGVGIIHNAEPYQAVFFSKANISNVERVHNKWSAKSVQYGKELGATRVEIQKQFANTDNLNDDEILDLLNRFGGLKRVIQAGVKPTESVQRVAVKQDAHLSIIAMLKVRIWPSEEAQIIAVRNAPGMLLFLYEYNEDVSEKVMIEAIRQRPELIEFLANNGVFISDALKVAAYEGKRDRFKN